jgi:hypothetical protein
MPGGSEGLKSLMKNCFVFYAKKLSLKIRSFAQCVINEHIKTTEEVVLYFRILLH